MKKKFFAFLLIMEICFCLCIMSNKAYALTEYEEGFLVYTVQEDFVTITGYNGSESEVTIPSNIGGNSVGLISAGAFSNASTVTKINLPDTIMIVEKGAFSAGQTIVYDSNTDNPIVMPPAQQETTKNQSQGSQSGNTAQSNNNEQSDKETQQTQLFSEKSENESGIMSTEKTEETIENGQPGEDVEVVEGGDIDTDEQNELTDLENDKKSPEMNGTNYSSHKKNTVSDNCSGENKVQLIIIDVVIIVGLGLICILFHKRKKKN